MDELKILELFSILKGEKERLPIHNHDEKYYQNIILISQYTPLLKEFIPIFSLKTKLEIRSVAVRTEEEKTHKLLLTQVSWSYNIVMYVFFTYFLKISTLI